MNGRNDAMTTTGGSDMEVRSPKNRILAMLFCLFFGVFGVHRLYVGKFWSGLFQFFTAGGFGVWWIIDFVLLLMGRFKDSEGRVLGPPQNETQRSLPSPAERERERERRRKHLDNGGDKKDDEVMFEEDDLLADPLEKEFEKLEQQQQQQKS